MKWKYLSAGIAVFLVWHLLCHFLNWYFEIWWSDIVAHIIAGILAGMLWWKIAWRFSTSKIFFAFSIISFSVTVSVFWEFWEFSNWRYSFLRNTIGRIQQQFIPYWGNNLGDIFWGLVGGCVIAYFYLQFSKEKN